MNIYEKLSKITQEITTVAKNLQVGEGRNRYKAVGEADVLAAVKPVEAKYGVYSYPLSRRVIESGEMVSKSTYKDEVKETKRLYLRVETVYRFVNIEKPEEYVDIMTYGDGVDTQDKAPGKAMTYSDKYALLKAYKIQTGDDPDQNASDPLSGMTTKPAKEASQIQKDVISEICRKHGVNLEAWLRQNGATFDGLTADQAGYMLSALKKKYGDD